MKLRALSSYNGDSDTRFGDCILIYGDANLVVYDCGHDDHAREVGAFLQAHPEINQIHVVISHNDCDHTDGVQSLLEDLSEEGYSVTVYTALYLKSARKILKQFENKNRKLEPTKQHILETFDHIKEIVEKATDLGFKTENAVIDTEFCGCSIVGPTEDEFSEVVAKAIEDGEVSHIEGETVMNAASIQVKCTLNGSQTILLCGDATPSYLHDLDQYDIIQLPHHGKLDSAKEIFDKLKDPYSKQFFVSDNTGSAATSGGSDDLVTYMKQEKFSPAHNTQNGVVNLPKTLASSFNVSKGVRLGAVDFRLW